MLIYFVFIYLYLYIVTHIQKTIKHTRQTGYLIFCKQIWLINEFIWIVSFSCNNHQTMLTHDCVNLKSHTQYQIYSNSIHPDHVVTYIVMDKCFYVIPKKHLKIILIFLQMKILGRNTNTFNRNMNLHPLPSKVQELQMIPVNQPHITI